MSARPFLAVDGRVATRVAGVFWEIGLLALGHAAPTVKSSITARGKRTVLPTRIARRWFADPRFTLSRSVDFPIPRIVAVSAALYVLHLISCLMAIGQRPFAWSEVALPSDSFSRGVASSA